MSHEDGERDTFGRADKAFAGRALESAESYVARSAGAGETGDGGGPTFSAAFRAICEWGVEYKLIFPASAFEFFRRPPDGFGDEHEAWFDESRHRWFKATYPNRFGLAWGRSGTATVGEYLSRLVLQNRYFWDDIRLVALANCDGKLRVITSQQNASGAPASYLEIQQWFEGMAFTRLELGDRIAWYRRFENLLVADAHEGNVIKSQNGTLIPIDLNVVHPVGELFDWANSFRDRSDGDIPADSG